MQIRVCFTFLFFLSCLVSAGTQDYRGIVYRQGSLEPLKGVLVSLEHTRTRTWTDNEGRFVLTNNDTSISKTSNEPNPLRVHWNYRSKVINFFNASSINEIRIYDLNGRVVFQSVLNSDNKSIKIPFMARGVYLLRLREVNGKFQNHKINTSMPSAFINFNKDIPLSPSPSFQPVKLLFRHDDYFPLDYEINYPRKNNIVVTLKVDPRSLLFSPNKVHSFDFTISKKDSLLMEKEALEELYRPAQLSFDGKSLGIVGLRYKGSSFSLGSCFDAVTGERYNTEMCHKISLKVKFNKYQDKLRLCEMKELNLHSMFSDDSKMRDMLAYKLFRDMGIYSPRTSYVKVSFNGVFQGLFLAVEAIDGRFTKARWPEAGDGNLYKEVWPISNSLSYYFNKLETNNDDLDSTKVARMVDFYNAVDSSDSETFTKNVSPFVDFNYWIRYLAVDRAIKNWDGITAWYSGPNHRNNHNYFLYEEEKADGKVWLIPWDLDNTFHREDPFIDVEGVPNWNEKPQSCQLVPVFKGTTMVTPSNCDKFTGLTADNYWTEFVMTGNELLNKIFTIDNMAESIDNYSSIIDTLIEEDPYVDYNVWKEDVNTLKEIIRLLHNQFYKYVNQIEDVIDTTNNSSSFTGNAKRGIDRHQ
jgi:spore coat protein CotH